MLHVEVDNDKHEIKVYHKFKVGDEIYVRAQPKRIQKSQNIESVVVFVKDNPIVCYTTGLYQYCYEYAVNFFNEDDDTDNLNITTITDHKFKIGDKVIWKSDYHKTSRVVTDIEINITKSGNQVYYYLNGGEDNKYGRQFGDYELMLVN